MNHFPIHNSSFHEQAEGITIHFLRNRPTSTADLLIVAEEFRFL